MFQNLPKVRQIGVHSNSAIKVSFQSTVYHQSLQREKEQSLRPLSRPSARSFPSPNLIDCVPGQVEADGAAENDVEARF